MQIAIIDDNHVQLEHLSRLTSLWAAQNGTSAHVSTFDSGDSFLFNWSENKCFDIALLDIQMKGIDGISLARELRKRGDKLVIIFITGVADYIAEGYDVSALHYLIKPVKQDKLFECLTRAVQLLKEQARSILLPKAGGNVRVNANDILYAEVMSHTITLHFVGGQEDFNMRIADMEVLLGDGFLRCHRSFIASLKHVCRVTKTAVILDNGVELPLSRGLYDEANQAFIKYN